MEIKLIFKKGTPNWLFLQIEKNLLGETVFFGRNDRKSPVMFSLTLKGTKKIVGQRLVYLAKLIFSSIFLIEPSTTFDNLPNGAEFLLASELADSSIEKKRKLFKLPPAYKFAESSVVYNACTAHEKCEFLSISPETKVIWLG